MDGRTIVKKWRSGYALGLYELGECAGLAEAIDAALAQARAKERERACVVMLRLYDAWRRSGWEEGPTLTQAIDSIHDFLCNAGCDPALSESAAIRGRTP